LAMVLSRYTMPLARIVVARTPRPTVLLIATPARGSPASFT
jgi:hypothetical protein